MQPTSKKYGKKRKGRWDVIAEMDRRIVLISIAIMAVLFSVFVLILGFLLMPHVFYDQWIWKYYWGPVVADALDHPVSLNGIYAYEGYTVVSEITYGVILVFSLYGIYRLLRRLRIVVDWRFCGALMPYILFGPVGRVLEDTGYFKEPFVYWFISPFIYVQIALYALFFLMIGYYAENISKRRNWDKNCLISIVFLFVFTDVFYIILWFLGWGCFLYVIHPIVFLFLSFLAVIPVLCRWMKHGFLTVNTVLFSGGLLFLFPGLYLVGRWILGFRWGFSSGVRFDVFVVVVGLVSLITYVVYLVARRLGDDSRFAVYMEPLNMSMLFGHLLDGVTSYVSIYDPFNMGLPMYLEKHPASNVLMGIWGPLFPIVKFVLVILIVYVLDVLYREELRHHMVLIGLIKIGVVILGLSPGMRDLLRVTLGV
ncbi:MAG: hypothetical protein DRN08_01295 [Thermoplasmata archaeon]|nr:MAG: hypothetical protein DRN08_01295 [Thermoplasmata archaeon]